jgi:hypothetical protein
MLSHVSKQSSFLRRQSNVRKTIKCNAYSPVRVCTNCKHFDSNNNTCKLICSVGKPIQTLYCRTNEHLCGTEAKYFSPKYTFNQEYLRDVDYNDEYAVYAKYVQSQGWEPTPDSSDSDTDYNNYDEYVKYVQSQGWEPTLDNLDSDTYHYDDYAVYAKYAQSQGWESTPVSSHNMPKDLRTILLFWLGQ